MDEIERVEVGSTRAYVTKDRAVYEDDGWIGSKRQVFPVSRVTGVTVEERGSWILLLLGALFGFQCAGSIVTLGFLENSPTWAIFATVASGAVAGIFLTAFLLLKWTRVRVTAADTAFEISGRAASSARLKEFARATASAAATDQRRRRTEKAVTH